MTARDENTHIAVQTEPFSVAELYRWAQTPAGVGATTLFVGKVRDLNLGEAVSGLYLEHYPQMTQNALAQIVSEARERWALARVAVVHRVGQLAQGDEIVLVAVSSAHRGDAYAANEFIMDYLKTRAPFWKRETTEQGERWIEARDSDNDAAARWEDENDNARN